VWSSDRLRALQTAKELLAGAGIQAKVSVDYRLRERFYGGFENLKTPQILELFDEGLFDAARDVSRMVWRPRGGETFVEVLQRLDNFILDHVLQPRIIRSGLPVLISTHGNILRLLHARAKALPEPHLRVPVNGGLLTLDLNVTPDSGQIQFVVVDEPEWEE
jgi:broad specificity phosphatase PhoE